MEHRAEVPIFLGNKGFYLSLAVDYEPQRHRLHASRAEFVLYLFAKHGRDLITDEPIEDAPRLLCVDKVLIDGARVVERLLHGVPAYLVELYPDGSVLGYIEERRDVPGYSLALAVGVGREQNGLRAFCRRSQPFYRFLFVVDDGIARRIVVFYIYRKAVFRQIAHVSARSEHLIARAEIFLHGLELAYTLDDDEFHLQISFCRARRLPSRAINVFGSFSNEPFQYERRHRA